MGDIGMIKVVCLPGSSAERDWVVRGVVVLGSSVSLRVYRREEGEETINTEQTNATQCMTWQYAMLGVA
jgi:hypothetical protein